MIIVLFQGWNKNFFQEKAAGPPDCKGTAFYPAKYLSKIVKFYTCKHLTMNFTVSKMILSFKWKRLGFH